MAFLQHQHMNTVLTVEFIPRKKNYHTFDVIFSFYWKTQLENKIEATRQTKLSWASFQCCKVWIYPFFLQAAGIFTPKKTRQFAARISVREHLRIRTINDGDVEHTLRAAAPRPNV